MPLLLTAQDLSLAFGWRPLLDHVNFSLESGERVALMGRNGEGKSTLLNVLRGAQTPDDGSLRISEGVRIAYLPQDPPAADARTVREVVRDGLAETAALVERYQTLLAAHDAHDADELARLEAAVAAADGWQLDNRIDGILQRFDLDGAAQMADLSGGWRRRVWLARVLVARPDVLLLDEPTNHLDLDMRHALTLALQSFQGALIVVSHDRSLLEATTDSFLLIDKGRLNNFDGDLNDYRQWRLAQENAAAAPAASAQSQSRKDTKRIEAQIRQEKAKRSKPIQQKIDKAEKEITRLTDIQTACEAFLAQESAYSEENKPKLQETLAQLTETKVKLTQLEENWLQWQEELEQIQVDVEAEFSQ